MPISFSPIVFLTWFRTGALVTASACLICFLGLQSELSWGQEDEFDYESATPAEIDALLVEKLSLQWEEGPTRSNIGQQAEIELPASYRFLGKKGTQDLLRAFGNTPGEGTSGMFSAVNSTDWFVVFSFDDVGYVQDDEKEDIDKDALYEHFQAGTDADNEARRAQGISEMSLEGWQVEPFYNVENNSLEWALRFRSDGTDIVNYFTKRLGRNGVMNCNLVVEPSELERVLPEVRQVMNGFDFQSGKKYAEFQEGDRMAEYGLTALVAGGALAVAAKSGLLAKFWKVIVIGFLAVAGFIKKLFGGGESSSS